MRKPLGALRRPKLDNLMNRLSAPRIRFQSYNPYEARFPGFKVVSRDTLHLIKVFRAQGYVVIVEPEDGSKLNYLSQKGWYEILSDPIVLFVVGIPISILSGIISAWLYDRLKQQPRPDEALLSIELDEEGNKIRYNYIGQPISEDRFQSLLNTLSERTQRYADSQKTIAPDPSHPMPVNLEHTDRIVGWAEEFCEDEFGLKVEGIRIIDDETWRRIQNGDLKGLSIGGIVTKSTCSICNADYVDCNHITGDSYNGKECVNEIREFLIAEISIVREPVQPLARIQIVR